MELSSGSFQISSTGAWTDFLLKSIEIEQGFERNRTQKTSRSHLQLLRLICFTSQLNLNKDLNGTELKHFQILSTGAEASRSPLHLPKPISFRNQLNLNKDLNGNELRKLPDLLLQLSRLISLTNQLNLNKDLNGTELKHFQIHSTAVETDFPLNLKKDLNGNELRKLPDLLYSYRA